MADEKIIGVYTSPTENALTEITDFIHDWVFDLEKINFDSSSKIVTIPFEREFYEHRQKSASILGRASIPICSCCVKIFYVNEIYVKDTERVGSYDFGNLEFDESSNRVIINTNIPLEFTVYVSKFKISMSCDENPVGFRKSLPFGL